MKKLLLALLLAGTARAADIVLGDIRNLHFVAGAAGTWVASFDTGGTPEPPSPTPGYDSTLVAWWRMEVIDTASIADSASNHPVALTGSPTLGAGKTGTYSLYFDGTGNQYGLTDDAMDWPKNSDYTVAMWIKTDVAPTYSYSMTPYVSGGQNYNWSLPSILGPDLGFSGQVQSERYYQGVFDYYARNTSVSVYDGVWHHYAATYNRASPAVAVWVDGVLYNPVTGGSGEAGQLASYPGSIRLGSYYSNLNPYKGWMDDFRVYNRRLSDAEIQSLGNQITWADAGAGYPAAMDSHVAVTNGGYLYVAGGSWNGGADTAHMYRYDPAANSWSARADMPRISDSFGMASLGQYIYIVGGLNQGVSYALARYDSVADTWINTLAALGAGSPGGCCAHKSRIYVVGGWHYVGGSQTTVANCYYYTPGDDAWTEFASLPADSCYGQLVEALGSLYYMGGYSYGAGHNGGRATLYRYNDDLDTWSTLASMPGDRNVFAAAEFNGRIWVMTGITFTGTLCSDVWSYSIQDNEWRVETSHPKAMRLTVGGQIDGYLYTVGGLPASGDIATTYKSSLVK